MDLTLVVPAAGRGVRMISETRGIPKCLLTICGRPILQYVLDLGISLSVQRIVVVINTAGHSITACLGNSYSGVPISYVIQDASNGLADAVLRVRHLVNDRFIVVNADEIHLNGRHSQAVSYFCSHNLDGLVGYLRNAHPTTVQTGYAVEVDNSGRVLRLEEKPAIPCSTNLGVGFWLLSRSFFDFLEITPLNPLRGERDFVSAIQLMIDARLAICALDLGGQFFNINTPSDKWRAEDALSRIFRAPYQRHSSLHIATHNTYKLERCGSRLNRR